MADINDVISENLGLVYKLLHSFHLINDQDAESLAYEALYKAIVTYDGTSALSTYATCVITNALRYHLRNLGKKRQLTTCSLYAPVSDLEEKMLVDVIPDGRQLDDALISSELGMAIPTALAIVYDGLETDTGKTIFTVWMESDFTMSQTDIAKKVGVSQPLVSRVLRTVRNRLKKELEDYL